MYTLVPPSYRCFIPLIGQAVSEKKIVEYYGDICVYCPRVGADQPLGSRCSQKINLHSFKFFPSNDIFTFNAWATYVDLAVK